MAYTIIKSDGTILTTIPDGTINVTSTSLGLPGKNFAGYGESIDTNFVHQLENFANSSPPPNPIRGQLWFNTNTNLLYICPADGTTNASDWISLAITASNANTTFGQVNVTGNLNANNATITNDILGNSLTVNFANVNTLATMSSANIFGNANIGNLTTTVVTTGSATTPGTLTGLWTASGTTSGNVINVNGNLGVTNGIYASSIYINGVPVSPTGNYTNQNVNEYLTGSLDFANRFQGNIYPNVVFANTGSFTGNVSSGNLQTQSLTYSNAIYLDSLFAGRVITIHEEGGAGNATIEFGRYDGVASQPKIDFHSGTTVTNYDSRIQGSGGNGTSGAGNLSLIAANTNISNNASVGAALSVTGNTTSGNITSLGTANIVGATTLGSTLSVTGNTTAANITVNGQLNVPNRPAALASRTGTDQSSGTVLIFNSENYDITNAYNPSTGEFTAPSAGLYQVSACVRYFLIDYSSPADGSTSVTVNGTPIVTGFIGLTSGTFNGILPIDISVALNLNANDVVRLVSSVTLFTGSTRYVLNRGSYLSIYKV